MTHFAYLLKYLILLITLFSNNHNFLPRQTLSSAVAMSRTESHLFVHPFTLTNPQYTPSNHHFIPQLKRCLEQKRFRRRSRFGHYHADPTFAFNNSSFVIQHNPPATATGTAGSGTTPATAANGSATGTVTTNTPAATGTAVLASPSTSTITATTTPGILRSLPRNRSYFAYRAMAMEIQAAEYFLPKGRASLYPPFGQSSSGWMQPGMMSMLMYMCGIFFTSTSYF